MLSKCANPDCAEKFLFLHCGKLFYLTPTPEVEACAGGAPPLRERFWLCDRCAEVMTIVWDGTKAKLIPLLRNPTKQKESEAEATNERSPRSRAAHAGIQNV
jgi:hypothetical protein